MTIIAIIFSLGISYFMYTLVFELRFFPFMNVLATVVAVGIGADDAFIFCKVWQSLRQEKNSSTIQTMNDTFQHAFVSMFITSLTTAAAFFASYISSITAVCCFSVFAAMAVLANCVLMMSWLPACMVIWDDWYKNCNWLKRRYCSTVLMPQCRMWGAWLQYKCALLDKLWNTREQILIDGVIRFRIFWLVFLSGLAVVGAVIVLYYPKLQLPNSAELQLFETAHPFEKYDLIYKNMFWFQRRKKEASEHADYAKLPLRFVWGVLPVDNGNTLDPDSCGTLEFDEAFDISEPESQEWLLNFCRDLRLQPFYKSTSGPLLTNCFIETLINFMKRPCKDPFSKEDRSPCCETEHFPYSNTVFNTCVVEAVSEVYMTPLEFLNSRDAGLKFSRDQFPTITAVVVEYNSNYSYSMNYKKMNEFYTTVENWMINQLANAPLGMQGGWFTSDLKFYDLQRVLSQSTVAAIGVSMGIALSVLLLGTLNVLTSFYAVITISCSIFVIIGMLVLLGWKLNVLESIAVSTTIGLTVDFSLHYTVSYGLCPNADNRIEAVRYALSHMAGPTTMAALTTGAAGAFMMPSVILPYIQIGIFLVAVMSISWIYATFHLGSLLAIAGPEQHFGQFHYPRFLRCSVNSSQGQVCGQARSRPTSSSLIESHELDSLSSKSGMRPTSRGLQRSLSGGKSSTSRYFTDQSPSATSAITIIMTEDN